MLVRIPLGTFDPGTRTVTLTRTGTAGNGVYFDFIEIAYPSTNLPDFTAQPQLSRATDWDTYHSQSPAERTAWLIQKLGFTGRVNHYTGPWFYEITRPGTQYASLSVILDLALDSTKTPIAASTTIQCQLAAASEGTATQTGITVIEHLVLLDDTSATVSQAFRSDQHWDEFGLGQCKRQPTHYYRARHGRPGQYIGFAFQSLSPGFIITAASNALSGGIDGTPYDLDPTEISDGGQNLNATLMKAADFWRTDLTVPNPSINATNLLNRAARDWHLAFFTAIKNYGLDAVAAFSTELGNGDPSAMPALRSNTLMELPSS